MTELDSFPAPPPRSLTTDRLLLRQWTGADREPFAAMNADPAVMEHFPAPMTREQSDGLVDRIIEGWDTHGFGLWALEVRETGRFIGFTGLSVPRFEAHFTPAVEVGWRLSKDAWGNGYATEAARAALGDGFGPAGLAEILSFTSTTNVPSQRVMQRIGMSHDPADDFDHPRLEKGHRLQRHVLYRISRAQWEASQ
jgi:RimJ/RimL family protein N-acetyltransferase